MYVNALNGLGGVPEWQGWPGMGPINQAAVNARWAEIGQSPPAPLVPAELLGLWVLPTRGPRLFSRTLKGKPLKVKEFKDYSAVNDFMNFWGKVAVDPYRKTSTASKIGGAILQVAAVALPVFGYAQAAAGAANTGLALSKAKSDEKKAISVMTPAVDAYMAQESQNANALNAAKDAEFAAQLKALQLPAADSFAPVSLSPSTAQIKFPAAKPAPKNYFGMTQTEAALVSAALLGVLLLRSR